ncbi:MAG: hypothetical protein H8D56_03570 [Planctomycetes bacterium]|nr:hypothetical protein [Planctomycetota bacterium]
MLWINLAIIVAVVYGIYRVFTYEKFVRKMTNILRKKIIKKEIFHKVSFEELLLATVRGGETIPNPTANMKIMLSDELICFGKLENIKNRISMNP